MPFWTSLLTAGASEKNAERAMDIFYWLTDWLGNEEGSEGNGSVNSPTYHLADKWSVVDLTDCWIKYCTDMMIKAYRERSVKSRSVKSRNCISVLALFVIRCIAGCRRRVPTWHVAVRPVAERLVFRRRQ